MTALKNLRQGRKKSTMDSYLQMTSVLWLLTVVLSSTTAQYICARHWSFHESTGSCFRVFPDEKNFYSAKAACEQYRGGPQLTYPGWLAGIHNANTDAFVKRLLGHDQLAFIGLYRDPPTNQFYWADKTTYSLSNTRWSAGEPIYDCAYITQTSLKTTGMSTFLSYVCQTHAMFPSPTFDCEPIRIGATFPPLTCRVDVYNSFGNFESFVLGNSRQKQLTKCFSDYQCSSSNQRISAVISNDGGRSLSTTVNLGRAVTRSDDRISLDCSYQFSKTPNSFLTESCEIEVYNVPSALNCRHTLGDILVITCEAEGVYPQADSSLVHYLNENLIGHWSWSSAKPERYFDKNLLFFRSRFEKRRINKMSEGLHKLEIFVYPNASFTSDRKKKEASLSDTVEFIILAPTSPPTFFSGNNLSIVEGKLTVTEGQETYLICRVNGGNPPVYETKITCDSGVGDPRDRKKWLSQQQTAEAKFVASRAMPKKFCACTANHISLNYRGRTTLELNILYPIETVTFKLNDMEEDEIEMNAGEQVTFVCVANGNPKPRMRIVHLVDNGKAPANLADSSNSESLEANLLLSGKMSGVYICSAHNDLNTEDITRRIHLIVISSPNPCIQKKSTLDFSATLNQDVDLKICVYAYPPPESLKLARTNILLGEDNYEIGFKYIRPDETMAIVRVKIKASDVQFGELELHSKQRFIGRSRFTFNLVRPHAPSCPQSVSIASVGTRSVSLSWQPVWDTGISQIFTLTVFNSNGQAVDKYNIQDDGHELVSINVTDLNPLSKYRFRLSVRIEDFVTECPNLTTGTSTRAERAADDNSSYPKVGLVVGVFILVVIILIVIAAAVILIVRKIRKSPCETEQVYSEIIEKSEDSSKQHKVTKGKDETDTNSKKQQRASDRPLEQSTSSSLGNINLYNNAAAVRTNTTEQTQNPDTIHENLKSKGPKPQPSPRKSRDVGVTFAINSPTSKTESDSKHNIDDLHTKNKTKDKEKKELATGSHSKGSTNPENEVVLKNPSAELVYIEVDIEPKKDGAQVRSANNKDFQEEPVTYASVNFHATVNSGNAEGTPEIMNTSL